MSLSPPSPLPPPLPSLRSSSPPPSPLPPSPPSPQGQLISESGTMSGGGGRPSRGRMALGSVAPKGPSGGGPADAKAAQAELRQAEQQLEEATQVGGVGGGSGGAAAGGGNAGRRGRRGKWGEGGRGMYTSGGDFRGDRDGTGCIATAASLMGPCGRAVMGPEVPCTAGGSASSYGPPFLLATPPHCPPTGTALCP